MYTRCDGFWNCKNGSDELNCPDLSNICAENEFKCVSFETFQFICLPTIKAGDGHIDCFGGTDERFHCRNEYSRVTERRFRCWNTTECIDTYSLCTSLQFCPYGDQNKFCDRIDTLFGICEEYIEDPGLERHPSRAFLCNLDESLKEKKSAYFTLTAPEQHSMITESESSKENDDILPYRDYKNGSLNVAWLCNRGLLVWRSAGENKLSDHCFCPPAYYGHRCQFQNQRISLSYRAQTFEWRTVFTVLIVLTDNTSQIHSYEQRSYLLFEIVMFNSDLICFTPIDPRILKKNTMFE